MAYHALMGVQTFIVYDNGSTDGTVRKVQQIAWAVDVHVVCWAHATGPRAQGDAYLDCLSRFRGTFDWMLCIDSDEFLASADGASIQTLVRRHREAAAIAFNWACFGSAGHVSAPFGLTIENFRWRAVDDFGPNAHTKMLVQADRVIDYVNPHYFTTDGTAFRASGNPVDWRMNGITQTVDLAAWRVNHYFVRSRAQWIRKMLRGYRSMTVRHEREFDQYDRNDVEDETAARHGAEVRRWLRNALPTTTAGARDAALRATPGR